MKRIVFVCLLCLALISCNQNDDILSYQKGNVSARCIINEKYEVEIIKREDIRELKIISPKELDNVSFVLESDTWSAVCDGTVIPLDTSSLDGICALAYIFDLDSSAISTAYDEKGEGIISFDMVNACYTVTYNGISLPQRVQITSDTLDFDVEIISITKTDVK